jgi:hypothetical protein
VALAKVWVRRQDGTVDGFSHLHEAHRAAAEGDVIVKVHRGGHVEYEIVVAGPKFVEQPRGWRPAKEIPKG